MANADRIIELLHEAKARPAGPERARFLDEACGNDSALKEQILSLLAADAAEGESAFLKNTPIIRQTILPTEKPGDRIGRYKLLEQIGEGGCGVVYMAEQEEPVRRRVALKVIKLGMDTKQVIARFEAERQALALMDHPNIAKVLDGGATQTGRPYFVMELVRGVRITEFCDEARLSIEERLRLFVQVCQAIQHAHQKGIIHRDLKPSNILVTVNDGAPVPKVIDFGIAKATGQRLTDKTLFTQFNSFIGTPAYTSPEQAEMSSVDIDTRSDIYSLGVLLYELLTGQTPFDGEELMRSGLDEMRRIIRDDQPPRPSNCLDTLGMAEATALSGKRKASVPELAGDVRGDLDWIVMKCLEKDRSRRYETANGIAADIHRHLENEPILARPPSNLYKFQKLVRRNKLGFAAASAVLAALIIGLGLSTWLFLRERVALKVADENASRAEQQAQRAEHSRQQAEANEKKAASEAARSEEVAQFLQDMLSGVGPSVALGRDTKMLREILDKTAERIGTDLKDQPDVEAKLRNTIGVVYYELGDFDKSEAMHREALTIQRKFLGNENASVATSLYNLGQVLRYQRKLADAETAFRESLAMRRKLFGNEHPAVAESLNRLGSLLSIELKNAEPEALLREALATQRKLFGNEHADVGESLDNLGHVLRRQSNLVEAAAMHYEGLAIRKKVFGDEHPKLIYSFQNLAQVLEAQGYLAGAEAMLRDALSMSERLFGQNHQEIPYLRSEVNRLLRAQGKPES